MTAPKHAERSGHKCDFTNKHQIRTTTGMNLGRILAILDIERQGGIIVWVQSHRRYQFNHNLGQLQRPNSLQL